MPSIITAAVCALVATAYWALLGTMLGRRLLPPTLARAAAPILGWAVHSAIALPLFYALPFTALSVAGVALALLCAVAALYVYGPVQPVSPAATMVPPAAMMPLAAVALAAIVALAPASAVTPQVTAGGVRLSAVMFDHSKLAMIDAMTRLGMPPVNPFFGLYGEPGRLAYYYLYYFSAAQCALLGGLTGWEADIAMTWFAAFTSVLLAMGIAVHLSDRRSAAFWAGILALSASLRMLFNFLLGDERLGEYLAAASGYDGWLFQSFWVPQHLIASSCVVLTTILLCGFAVRRSLLGCVIIILTVAAGFESSTYVGGVTFALAALVIGPVLVWRVEPKERLRLLLWLAAAAVAALLLVSPFLHDQVASVASRETASPIILRPMEVFGWAIPQTLRAIIDGPSYWLVWLPFYLPATYVAGLATLAYLLRTTQISSQRTFTLVLCGLTAMSLIGSWLLVSTVGYNNDLGWRALLPAAVVLMAAAACGLAQWRSLLGRGFAVVALAGLLLGVPGTYDIIFNAITDNSATSRAVFAETPEMWAAVRRHSTPTERVANNPLFVEDMTPWAVNSSWALLSNRNSCFAGRELTLAYAALSNERREGIDAQFIRVFAGKGSESDIYELANEYGCRVVVLTRQDGAWAKDPFDDSPLYRLVEEKKDAWRVYRAVDYPLRRKVSAR